MSDKANKKSGQPSHLKDLVLLFAIPIGIAIFAAATLYVPRLFANPKFDFIYSVCDTYDCRDGYQVDAAGHISKVNANPSDLSYYPGISTIHYYDASDDSTRSLTLEDARDYRLSTSSKAADGYSLIRDETDNGFLFWGNYDEGWYLKNGSKKKRVELTNNSSYYSQNVRFLGWVEK